MDGELNLFEAPPNSENLFKPWWENVKAKWGPFNQEALNWEEFFLTQDRPKGSN